MKKLVITALATLAVASYAQANFYAEGNLGYSKVKSSGLEYGEINKGKLSPSIAVGYKFVDWRLALDYTNYGNISYDYSNVEGGVSVSGAGKLKPQSLGLSAIYDIQLNHAVTPYVGARVAVTNFKFDENSISKEQQNGVTTTTIENTSEKSTKVGYGIFAGATYTFAPNWALNGALEYNYLGKIEDVKFKQYGAKVGVRYEF